MLNTSDLFPSLSVLAIGCISETCVWMVGDTASYSEGAGCRWQLGYQISSRQVWCGFPQSVGSVLWSTALMTRCNQLFLILINNQLDAQFPLHTHTHIYTFRFSTCFEQPCAHQQGSQLYQYNVWCVSLCVGDRPVCRSDTGRSPIQSDMYQMLYWYNWLSWWWTQGCSKHVENRNKCI